MYGVTMCAYVWKRPWVKAASPGATKSCRLCARTNAYTNSYAAAPTTIRQPETSITSLSYAFVID